MRKLLYLIVVVVALGLIVAGCNPVVPTSEKGNQKPEISTPILEKITFIHYVKSSGRSKPVWDDTVDKYKLLFGGIKWSNTMHYEVNPDGSNLTLSSVISTLETSLEIWDSKTSFELFDSPRETTETLVGYDSKNRVVWRNLGSSGIIAVNYLWYYPATKQIVESDIVFNSHYGWSTSGKSEAMDLQNIATHEFGHNGLNDLSMPPGMALTM